MVSLQAKVDQIDFEFVPIHRSTLFSWIRITVSSFVVLLNLSLTETLCWLVTAIKLPEKSLRSHHVSFIVIYTDRYVRASGNEFTVFTKPTCTIKVSSESGSATNQTVIQQGDMSQ